MVVRATLRPRSVRAGVTCPVCGGYARRECGGAICIHGHCFLDPRILPRNHQLSGSDRSNRIRQTTLDRSYTSPGRARDHVQEMLERLEGDGG